MAGVICEVDPVDSSDCFESLVLCDQASDDISPYNLIHSLFDQSHGDYERHYSVSLFGLG